MRTFCPVAGKHPNTRKHVWRFARDLSDRHAETIGCRTLDLVHVAVALSLGVKTFLTFDERQRAVAKLEGLTVKP